MKVYGISYLYSDYQERSVEEDSLLYTSLARVREIFMQRADKEGFKVYHGYIALKGVVEMGIAEFEVSTEGSADDD